MVSNLNNVYCDNRNDYHQLLFPLPQNTVKCSTNASHFAFNIPFTSVLSALGWPVISCGKAGPLVE